LLVHAEGLEPPAIRV